MPKFRSEKLSEVEFEPGQDRPVDSPNQRSNPLGHRGPFLHVTWVFWTCHPRHSPRDMPTNRDTRWKRTADYIGAFTLGLDIFLIIDTRIANFSDNLLDIIIILYNYAHLAFLREH